jgi:hypothetical protein
MSVTVKVDDQQARSRFDDFCKRFPAAVAQGLWAWGEEALTEAVRRAPIETGRLRRSAFQTPTRRMGAGWAIFLGFGAKHAVEVHERTDVPRLDGEPKFLENALKQLAPRLLTTINEVAQRAVSKGGVLRVRTGRGKFPNSPPAEG